MADAKPEMVWVDKFGWPVTYFRNRPITNFIRWCLHARGRALWYRVEGGLRRTREPEYSQGVGSSAPTLGGAPPHV